MTMTIELDAELAGRLAALALARGVSAEAFALETLRSRLQATQPPVIEPQDEWERRLLGAAFDCGVSPTDWEVSREGIYED